MELFEQISSIVANGFAIAASTVGIAGIIYQMRQNSRDTDHDDGEDTEDEDG